MNHRMFKNLIRSKFTQFARSVGLLQSLATLVLISFVTACASTPPPNQQIAAAEAAIAHAEQQQIPSYASPELTEARVKLTQARAAIVKKDMVVAERLAEQAELDADLASARSVTAAAKIVNDEMLKGTDVLKNEMQRNSGGTL